MTKLEMLLIRATKSKNPYLRLASIYRRFYVKASTKHLSKHREAKGVIHILAPIIDNYFPLTQSSLLNSAEVHLRFEKIKGMDSFYTVLLFSYIERIRYTEASKLPASFIYPVFFRRNYNAV